MAPSCEYSSGSQGSRFSCFRRLCIVCFSACYASNVDRRHHAGRYPLSHPWQYSDRYRQAPLSVPGHAYYDQTMVSQTKGGRRFCSEAEAQAAGWRKVKGCESVDTHRMAFCHHAPGLGHCDHAKLAAVYWYWLAVLLFRPLCKPWMTVRRDEWSGHSTFFKRSCCHRSVCGPARWLRLIA